MMLDEGCWTNDEWRMMNGEWRMMNDWGVLSCMGEVERRGWKLGVRARIVS